MDKFTEYLKEEIKDVSYNLNKLNKWFKSEEAKECSMFVYKGMSEYRAKLKTDIKRLEEKIREREITKNLV